MDYLIQEFSKFSALSATLREISPHLVIAGAREDETDEVMREARELLGEQVTFLVDYPYAKMPDFYRALDVFVLPSLFEMMGIVFAEAMACGVPVLAHQHPVMEYVVGDGGVCVDMEREGELAEAALVMMRDSAKRETLGRNARAHAMRMFAKPAVVERIMEMYKEVASV